MATYCPLSSTHYRSTWHPSELGTDRRVLGQRRGRVILRRPEERDVPPTDLLHPGPGAIRRRRIHRGLLQPPTASLDARLPHPVRSAHRLPDCGDRRSVINHEDLSKILDTAQPQGVGKVVLNGG